MKTVVKFSLNDMSMESRNKREIAALLDMGAKVILVCPKISNNEELFQKCTVIKYSVPVISFKQNRIIRYIIIISHWIKLSYILRKVKKDCISCHDLIALYIGWMSTWFTMKGNRPELIYDSHEYELGRNTIRSRARVRFIKLAEGLLIKRCAFSIVVNDSIAEEIQKIYELDDSPIVVRNIPNYWIIDPEKCKKRRQAFCEALNISIDTFMVMYHGDITKNRGIEKLLRAIGQIENIAVVIMGNGEESFILKLKQIVQNENIESIVLFHKAVPIENLWEYTGATDVGMILIEPTCRSYYLSLPNKLFENIQSGTPVITSDLPELRKITNQYGIGLCCNQEDVDDIVAKIELLKNNKEYYFGLKNNVMKAKEQLCWEIEQQTLQNAYNKIWRVK